MKGENTVSYTKSFQKLGFSREAVKRAIFLERVSHLRPFNPVIDTRAVVYIYIYKRSNYDGQARSTLNTCN